MTAIDLQKAVMRELQLITDDMLLKNPQGEKVKINIFEQMLPKRISKVAEEGFEYLAEENQEKNVMEEDDPYPYCIVRVSDGEQSNPSEKHYVELYLIIGLYDDDSISTCHESIMTIFQRFRERFYKNPVLENMFIMRDKDGNQKIKWTLQDEDTYPYYFGGLGCTFSIPGIEREDRYA